MRFCDIDRSNPSGNSVPELKARGRADFAANGPNFCFDAGRIANDSFIPQRLPSPLLTDLIIPDSPAA
jgi:hypothetical protein